jgi:hypothetical protein
MLDHGLGPWIGRGLVRRFAWGRSPAALVESLLLFLPLLALVVSDTPPDRLLPLVRLPAAKRTTQALPSSPTFIPAPGVTRIGEKANAAMPASLQASSKVGLGSDNRSQEQVILQDQPPNLRPAIPAPRKLKMLRDPYCKNPKLSPRMPMLKLMSSSYSINASVSRR